MLARNLLESGFAGPVMAVNPHEASIRSTLSYPAISDLPLAPDLAVIATPPDTVPALQVQLSAGAHRLSLLRGGPTLSPGDGGSAVLDAIFLTPARADPRVRPLAVPAARARSLCGGRYDWIELLAG